jgi:hypothetical protein
MNPLDGQGRFVAAALRLLQFVEQRRPTGRRFGADADARWGSFKGDLMTAHRIELLIRDADAEWPGAFGARSVYDLRGVAEDEPFGSQWAGIDPIEAEELWRKLRGEQAPASPRDVLQAIAAAWGITLQPHTVGPIAPTDRLVLVGPSAIAATIEAFAAGTALDWADQVTVIATPPSHRQLAAAATAVLGGTRPCRFGPGPKGARVIESKDAHPDDSAAAKG